MSVDLTVILTGIHTEDWVMFCDTLELAAVNLTYELIIIGPYPPTLEVQGRDYVRFVKSQACPNRCVQEATTMANGEYLSVACEGVFVPSSYDNMFLMLDSHNKEHKTVISGKYVEGASTLTSAKSKPAASKLPHFRGGFYPKSIKLHGTDEYWRIGFHAVLASEFIPNDWLTMNLHVIKTEYWKEIGGFDCQFECQAMALTDLAIRIQKDGGQIYLTNFFLMHLDHVSGVPENPQKGHGPVHHAQIDHDQPLYRSIYDDPSCLNRVVDYDNWKSTPDVWPRRKF